LVRIGNDPDSQTAEYLDRAASASRQAAGLARQMLTFSRRDETQRRYVHLGSVVLETLRLLEASLPPGVKSIVDIPTGGRAVLADASQVQQAFVNLWTNACYALPEQNGRITISLADVDVKASATRQHPDLRAGPYVRLTVRDNGRGMDPEVREQIFEPFFTTKPEGQGTGLGLTVVQNIVNSHQGAVVVESWPDQGTAIHLYFPAETSVRAEPTAPMMLRAEQPSPLGQGELVMLVDDHALVQDAMRSLLEELGYRVRVFGNPLHALDTFRAGAEDFDLVLTDLSMREMNGAELAREILTIRPATPVVIRSGYDLPGLRQCIRELGIREVLAKPVERDRLATALARALRRTNGAAGHKAQHALTTDVAG
jgi:CheY-like chemotaxis protein